MLVSIVLFVASIVVAAGVYLYVQFLDGQSKSKLQQLQRAKEAFQPALMQKITRLDDRMQTADQLLSAHLAPTVLFQVLQQVTLSTISFRNLNFVLDDPQNITIKMSGVAQSVNSVALQADLFSKSSLITSPIFSNINRLPDGVHFDVTGKINATPLHYTQAAASAAAPTQSTSTPSAAPAQNSPFVKPQAKQ